MIFASSGVGDKFDYHFDVQMFIAFDEIEFIKGKDATGVLGQMIADVESIFLAVEAESRRTGLIS